MDDVIIIRPSGKYALTRLVVTLFTVETIYALLFVLFLSLQTSTFNDRNFIIVLWLSHTLKFFILAAMLVDVIIRYLSMHYYITNHHLIVNRGIVNNDEKVYELRQVRKLSVFQDSLGKRFNYGNVRLLLGARGFEEHIELVNITNPRKIAKEIEQYLGNEKEPVN